MLSGDGLLRITGRNDGVVNLGGIKMSLLAAEDMLRTLPGVKDVATFGVTTSAQIAQRWAAIVREGEVAEDALRPAMRDAKFFVSATSINYCATQTESWCGAS
jgi:acyl-coenzyme A synthetase/AMP-(fatty) acid ligase